MSTPDPDRCRRRGRQMRHSRRHSFPFSFGFPPPRQHLGAHASRAWSGPWCSPRGGTTSRGRAPSRRGGGRRPNSGTPAPAADRINLPGVGGQERRPRLTNPILHSVCPGLAPPGLPQACRGSGVAPDCRHTRATHPRPESSSDPHAPTPPSPDSLHSLPSLFGHAGGGEGVARA